MLFVLTPDAVANPGALRGGPPPRQALGRAIGLRPRGGPRSAAFWRLLIEQSLTRYVIALAPFPAAMLIWPELALPISQAPILMFGIVLYIESSVLSVPTAERRRALIDPDDAGRGLDLLAARARTILTRIAAGRGLERGTLHLVVEQSAMAKVAPFTIVSVQLDGADPPVLALDEAEARLLRETLFDAELTERRLLTINLAQNRFLRDLTLDARGVSAHARLAALAAQEAPPVAVSARG